MNTTRKNRYQQMLCEYNRRRDKVRLQYPPGIDSRYAKRVKRINMKICNLMKAIRIIEQREVQMRQAADMVCEFFEINTFRNCISNGSRGDEVKAKKIFCKYVLENCNMQSWMLCDFLGTSFKGYARQTRLRFTQSFKTNKANYELWQRFKLFVKYYDAPVIELPQHFKTA